MNNLADCASAAINRCMVAYLFAVLNNERIIDQQNDEMAGLPYYDIMEKPQ